MKEAALAPGSARWLWGVLLGTLAVRLYWAWAAPLANDEAYYWDWSRSLQLSYLDHPPGVAWLAAVGRRIAPGALGARFAVPFVHLLATLIWVRCARLLKGAQLEGRELMQLLVLTEVVPAFSLEGVLLLPDSGLLLGLAAALYCFLKAALSAPGKSLGWALPAGVALGMAGLCKYHAAPVAIGLGLGLLAYWGVRGRWRAAAPFLAAAAIVAALVTLPVWVWNAQHAWASLRFQGDHGFGDLELMPLAALRAYLGQAVILTPLVLIGPLMMTAAHRRRGLNIIPLASALPLFALLELVAFGKQMLPHWLAPACWMLVPCLALQPWPRRAWRANLALGLVIAWLLPWVLTVKPLREALVASFAGRPGPLSELTIWDPLSTTLVEDPRLAALLGAPPKIMATPACPQGLVLAGLRWFWSAQLAFHLPKQPRLLSLDFNHPSYYWFRDYLPDFAECPVLVFGDARHLDAALLGKALTSWKQVEVTVPSHQDTAVVALLGQFRSRAELAALTAEVLGGANSPSH